MVEKEKMTIKRAFKIMKDGALAMTLIISYFGGFIAFFYFGFKFLKWIF